MSLRQQAIRGVFWTAVQNWGSSLVSIVVVFVLARLLGPEPMGLVAFATVFTAFLAIFQRQGFGQALIQREDLQPGHLSTAFWASSAAGVLLTVGLVLASGTIGALFDKPLLIPVLQALSLTLFIDSLGNTPQAILQRKLAFKSLAVRSLAASTVGGIVGVGMAMKGFGVWSLVGQRLATSVTGTAALWLASGWRPGFEVSVRHIKDIFGFGIFIMGNEALAVVNRQTAPLLIGTFLGDKALGYYHIGYQLLLMMTQLFTNTVSAVTLPTFSRLQHDHQQMRNAFLTATRMSSLLAFPAFLGAAMLAPEIVLGFIGDKWAPSIPIMQILAFLGIVQSVTFFNGPAIIACGKPSWAFALALANAVANVVVFAVAVHWGIVIVAAAYTVRGYLYAPFPLLATRRLIGLHVMRYLRQFVAPGIGSLVMVLAVWATKHTVGSALNLYTSLAACILVGALTYALMIRWIAPDLLRQLVEYVRLALPSNASSKT